MRDERDTWGPAPLRTLWDLRERARALGCWPAGLDEALLLDVICTQMEGDVFHLRLHSSSCTWPAPAGSGYLQVSQTLTSLAELDDHLATWYSRDASFEDCGHCRGALLVDPIAGVSPIPILLRHLARTLRSLSPARAALATASELTASELTASGLTAPARVGVPAPSLARFGPELTAVLDLLDRLAEFLATPPPPPPSGCRDDSDAACSEVGDAGTRVGELDLADESAFLAHRAHLRLASACSRARDELLALLRGVWSDACLRTQAPGILTLHAPAVHARPGEPHRLLYVHVSGAGRGSDAEFDAVRLLAAVRPLARAVSRRSAYSYDGSVLVEAPAALALALTSRGPWGPMVADLGPVPDVGTSTHLAETLTLAHTLAEECPGRLSVEVLCESWASAMDALCVA